MAALWLAVACGGCVSGRVLSGYPGYPFASFTVTRPQTSVEQLFPEVLDALEEEGYPIDFTDRTSGFIQTRPGPDAQRPILLNVVVGTEPDSAGVLEVWVAGFERTRSGDRRINPLDDTLWQDLMATSRRLSERLRGTAPVGPDGRAAPPGPGSEKGPA